MYLPSQSEPDADNGEMVNGLSDSSTAGSELILLVEDNPSVRELARRSLTDKGYTVLDAGDSGEALVLAHEQETIDLLLTDVCCPVGLGVANWQIV